MFNPFAGPKAGVPGNTATPAPVQMVPNTQIPINNPNPGADPTAIAAASAAASAAQAASSPMADFANLWQTDPKDTPVDPFAAPLMKVDPAKLTEAVGKMNFAQAVSPELVTKALSGDANAFTEALNLASRSAFSNAATMMTTMVENAISQNNGRLNQTLPDKFKSYQLQSTPVANPVLQDPAVQPMLEALKFQLSTKNPTMSAADVASKAENYFLAVSGALQQQTTKTTQASQPAEPDWGALLAG